MNRIESDSFKIISQRPDKENMVNGKRKRVNQTDTREIKKQKVKSPLNELAEVANNEWNKRGPKEVQVSKNITVRVHKKIPVEMLPNLRYIPELNRFSTERLANILGWESTRFAPVKIRLVESPL